MLFLLTSEQVTHKEIKTSQSQVLVSVKCRRKAGGKQPCWQNSQVSALCRAVTAALSEVQNPVPWFQGSSEEFPACDRSHKPRQSGTVTFRLQSWASFPAARLLPQPQSSPWPAGRALKQLGRSAALLPPSPSPPSVDPIPEAPTVQEQGAIPVLSD